MPTKDAICFGCDTVQQIDATLSEASCQCGGNIRPLFSLEAFRVGRLAHRIGGGYYVHSSIVEVAARVDRSHSIDWSNTRDVERKDGTKHVFAFDHYLREASDNLQTKDDLERLWIVGGLITLADALDKNQYFGNVPHLQLVRHLRNGVAHGEFTIRYPKELAKKPANNFSAPVKSPAGTLFEVTPTTKGSVFNFMGAGDFVDLFFSVEVHLLAYAIKP